MEEWGVRGGGGAPLAPLSHKAQVGQKGYTMHGSDLQPGESTGQCTGQPSLTKTSKTRGVEKKATNPSITQKPGHREVRTLENWPSPSH